jgi:cytidylate kinase
LEANKYVNADPEMCAHRTLREDKVRNEIARRVRCVCANLAEHEFQELVSKMAERQLRDEQRQRW